MNRKNVVLLLIVFACGIYLGYDLSQRRAVYRLKKYIKKSSGKKNTSIKNISDITLEFKLEIDEEKYQETEPPDEPVALRWNFSEKKNYGYDYYQMARGKSLLMDQNISQENETEGTLLMKSKGDGTATCVLKDMKARMKIGLDIKEEIPDMETDLPTYVIQGIKEDGSGDSGTLDNNYFGTVFFLPPENLELGETAEIPMSIPFNASGSMLDVKGTAKLTLEKYVIIDGNKCACLVAEYEISELDIPEELEGTYEFSMKGKSVSYFDLEEGCFISAEGISSAYLRAEIPSPKSKIDGFPEMDMPKVSKISTEGSSIFRISRNKSKD